MAGVVIAWICQAIFYILLTSVLSILPFMVLGQLILLGVPQSYVLVVGYLGFACLIFLVGFGVFRHILRGCEANVRRELSYTFIATAVASIVISMVAFAGVAHVFGDVPDRRSNTAESCIDGTIRVEFKEGGLQREAFCRNGKLDGPEKTYYRTGELMSLTNWKHGLREGTSTTYYKNGQAKLVVAYMADALDGDKTFYLSDGALRVTDSYKDGKLDGVSIINNDAGQLGRRIEYRDGVQHGWDREYDALSGTLLSQVWYVNGKREEIGQFFYPSGFLRAVDVYMHDEIVTSTTYLDGEKRP